MIHTPLFKRLFALLFLIACLHVIAAWLYLYQIVSWFDIPMHLLGGVAVALAYFTVFGGTNKSIIRAIVFVFIVGVLWEIFELSFGITFLSDGAAYVFDTAKDLTMDIIGGYIGSRYALRLLKK